MKITIDTNEDKRELAKIIQLLQQIVGEHSNQPNTGLGQVPTAPGEVQRTAYSQQNHSQQNYAQAPQFQPERVPAPNIQPQQVVKHEDTNLFDMFNSADDKDDDDGPMGSIRVVDF